MTEQAALAAGYLLSDFDDDEVEVWEENWPAVAFFMDYCATQWRVGMNGPTGLCYESVIPCLRTLRLPREKFDDMFSCIRALERGALNAMRESD